MPSLRVRRSLTRSMAAKEKATGLTGSAVNDWLNQIQSDPENRGRKTQRDAAESDVERAWIRHGMKRKRSYSDKDSESEADPASPVKMAYRSCNSVSDGGAVALPVKSFYGSRKKQIVSGSPLNDLQNLQAKISVRKSPPVVEMDKLPSLKLKLQSTFRKNKPRLRTKSNGSSRKSLSPQNPKLPEAKRAVRASPRKPDQTKKFFRYRSSQHSASTTVILQKGFQLKFQPGRKSADSGKSASKKNPPKQDNNILKTCPAVAPTANTCTSVNNDEERTTEMIAPFSPDLFPENAQTDIRPGSTTKDLVDSGMSFGTSHSPDDTLDVSCDNRSISSDPSVADSVLLLPTDIPSRDTSPNEDSAHPRTTDGAVYPVFATSPKSASSVPSTPQGRSSRLSQLMASTPGSGSSTGSKRSPKHVLKSFKGKDGREQMILDFGQKLIGAVHCEICGMTYMHGEPTDEATHAKFHQRLLNVLRFPGWKKECVVQRYMDGSRVIVVMPDDKLAMKKVAFVKEIVDHDLGFVVDGKVIKRNSKTYLYISADRKIVGCCIAETSEVGYRVIPSKECPSQDSVLSPARPWCCSTEPEPVKCGINRIWVLESERCKGIATKLLDSVRFNFLFGYPLKSSEIAFSDPTPDGKAFATRYTETACFKVYKPA